jgi:cysteinyl-tRNA synthetase
MISEGATEGSHLHREGEGSDADAEELINSLQERFKEAMDDDFNTALAIAAIFDTVRGINGWINGTDFRVNAAAMDMLRSARESLSECGAILGVLKEAPSAFIADLQSKRSKEFKIDDAEVEDLVDERWDARLAKDWKRSDEIRDQLAAMGVVLKDSAEGTTWELKG